MTDAEPTPSDLTPAPRPGWVFIDWSAHCSRSENFARRMGMRLLRRHRSFTGPVSFALKYAYQFAATSWDLAKERPEVIWCMTPTPLTALPIWAYCAVTGSRFAIDAHTGAFEGSPWAKLEALQYFLSRRAAITSVTNEFLAGLLREHAASALIVPDVPTELSVERPRDFGEGFHVVYVASYSSDEPFEIVVEAARRVPGVTLWLTGRPKGEAKRLLERAPTNVRQLGFLSREDYLAAIAGAHAVLALTTRDHTMQRAAYEAAYLGTPVLVSDWPVLRENFAKGSVLIDNTVDGLVRALERARSDNERLRSEAKQLREDKLERWRRTKREIEQLLSRE